MGRPKKPKNDGRGPVNPPKPEPCQVTCDSRGCRDRQCKMGYKGHGGPCICRGNHRC